MAGAWFHDRRIHDRIHPRPGGSTTGSTTESTTCRIHDLMHDKPDPRPGGSIPGSKSQQIHDLADPRTGGFTTGSRTRSTTWRIQDRTTGLYINCRSRATGLYMPPVDIAGPGLQGYMYHHGISPVPGYRVVYILPVPGYRVVYILSDSVRVLQYCKYSILFQTHAQNYL